MNATVIEEVHKDSGNVWPSIVMMELGDVIPAIKARQNNHAKNIVDILKNQTFIDDNHGCSMFG